jgi:hypothetical protein
MSETEPATAPNHPPRDAIIYIPSIDSQSPKESLDIIAQKIATALDKNAKTIEAKFTFKLEEHFENYGQALSTKVCTIFRKDQEQEIPVIDVYEMSYHKNITQWFDKQNFFVKCFLVGATILKGLPKFVAALFITKTGKTLPEKIQLIYGISILFLLFIYIILLVIAFFQAVNIFSLIDLSWFNNWLKSIQISPFQSQVTTFAEKAIVILTALGILTPQLKDSLNRAAVIYLGMVSYLDLGNRRNILLGQLVELTEHILEKKSTHCTYRRIHIISYSFGSILALDALFPSGKTSIDRFKHIHTLVTIGCPFDMIRTFWRNYFDDRHPIPGSIKRWFNIYSPADVIGSNFRDDANLSGATYQFGVRDSQTELGKDTSINTPVNIPYLEGPNPKNLTIMDWFMLVGLQAHDCYWEGSGESEVSCFYQIVANMYQEDDLLK